MRITSRLGTAGFALALAAIYPAASNQILVPAAGSVTLIYVGAKDCPPCEAWQRTDGAAFRDTPQFSRLQYREIKSPSLYDVLKDENWPEDLSGYRQSIDKQAGVPLWLVVADGRVVLQSFGLSQWREAVLPKLTQLLQ